MWHKTEQKSKKLSIGFLHLRQIPQEMKRLRMSLKAEQNVEKDCYNYHKTYSSASEMFNAERETDRQSKRL